MRYPFRDQFHKARKAVLRSADRLWPSADFGNLAEVLYEQTKPPCLDRGPDVLPDQAREYLQNWSKVRDREAVIRLDVPCTVDPKMGILFASGRVLWGSSDQPDRERTPRFFDHLRKPARQIPKAIPLHHVHGDNYFHFFLYVLSRVCVADRFGLPADIPYLVPEKTTQTSFFKQARELGVFAGRELVVQRRKEVIAVDEVYLTRGFWGHKPYFESLCEHLKVPMPQSAEKRIFVLRGASAANGRAFRNQEAVNHLVEAYGFELVDPSQFSFNQQIEIFSQASVIAGAHGAGLTNMIFRRGTPCKIIELFSPLMGSPQYYMLSKELGFDYTSLMTLNPEGRAFKATTEVDLDQLKSVLEGLG